MAQGPPPSDAGTSRSDRQLVVEASGFQASALAGSSYSQPQPLYNYAWQNPWPYYHSGQPYQQQYSYAQSVSQIAQQPAQAPQAPVKAKPPSPSPLPPPAPKFKREWDGIIKTFLKQAGLTQALRGFQLDMIVMDPDFEEKTIPSALSDLKSNLMRLESELDEETDSSERPLDERKLDYVHLSGSHVPRTPTSINKEIAIFIARNRARNDASNRREFLESLSEKRRRLSSSEAMVPDEIHSCARTDARPIDRDVQMKYDIAKNEEGPLRKTVKIEAPDDNMDGKRLRALDPDASHEVTPERYPGLDERIKHIETHFSVRYVPATPYLLLDRLKFLEDYIIRLEKEYPPWAALHFNQPRRGWPPPPRPTPIIVPSYMTKQVATAPPLSEAAPGHVPPSTKGKGKASTSTRKLGKDSSLLKAVMEKLEVQKAREDLAGRERDEA